MKKTLSLLLVILMCVAAFAACSSPAADDSQSSEPAQTESAQASESDSAPAAAGTEIYFLNFKPEIADVYTEIAAAYEEETGVKVKVETAAAGTYEATLKSEIAKTDAPTIFQINGPVGYQTWKDYCMDLSGSDLYSMLSDQSLAVTSGDGVFGIPYAVEGYGIIYNNAIMNKYFALDGAVAKSMDEINNFATLKTVVEDMQAKKDDLGIEGVFASTSLLTGEDWRWQTHLANVPMYYEFAENTEYDSTVLAGLATENIEFKYSDNYKNIFDLYLNDSVSEKALTGNISVNDSMAEFALGKCAMVQNGNWGASQILGVEGNTVADEDIKFLPIYTGMAGEENQGLCIGTENFFCINSQASAEKQQASIDFLVWLFSSDTGKGFVKDKLGFIAPFNTFSDDEKPSDPLAKEVLAWMAKDGVKTVPWTFAAFPSQEFKNTFGAALLEYANGTKTWDEVTQLVKDTWAAEWANVNG
jgi:raffinose/stachyose/melibiose transport system substrate-binding protein